MVGAGPGGVAAAVSLVRAGLKVVMVDKARFPRDKCCGDGLTTAALRNLERLGLDPGAVPSWQVVKTIRARSPGGSTATMELPRDQGAYAAVARRIHLDAALVDLARSHGVAVWEGTGLATLSPTGGPNGVVIGLSTGQSVKADYVIGADGAWSALRRLAGEADEDGYRGEWHAFRQYFEGVGPSARDLWIWMEVDLLPGYAWSFPLPDGRANVGMAILRRPGQPVGFMGQVWEGLPQRDHIADVLGSGCRAEGRHLAWPIPARIGRSSLGGLGGRVLFVGDAARAGDFMTGEGIDQALHTGVLAGRAIAEAGPHRPGQALVTYSKSIASTMAADHRMSELVSRALSRPWAVNGAIRLAGSRPGIATRAGRWLFEDEPRAIVATPRRWHRQFLSRPGAFR
ncbi:MAG: NAD(P)/FAD-dependent oxidoreductase [Acidimicrobiales bacterium]